MFKQYKLKDYRLRLVAYVVILTIIGIFVVGSADPSLQNKQAFGLAAGLVVMVIASLIDYNFLLKFRRIFYLLTLVILGIILIPGVGHTVGGATRWILIGGEGGFTFQPSELSKIFLILFFAAFFTKYRDTLNTWKMLLFSVILIGIPLIMILKEPNLSTTIIVAILFVAMIFVAGLDYKIVLGVLAVGIPAAIVSIILMLKEKFPLLQPYQYARIVSWLEPEKYPDDARQQVNSQIAIGSGQLWGKGLYNSSYTSLKNANNVSEDQTDFIFTVIGEELGFVGCIIIIILILLIVFECIWIAKNARDLGGRLIASGMAALIGFQSFVNIGVATGLLPNTGVPLPFVSYGLTSMVSMYIGIGLVLNVGLQMRKYGSGDDF